MNKKHFEQQFPSLKKNVFWEKQYTSERITDDREDYENACVDVSQVAKYCIDRQNLKEIPPKSFLIKIPEVSSEELNKWKEELNKLNRKEPIFLVNQNFELDTDWIKKDKVMEIIDGMIKDYEDDPDCDAQGYEDYIEVLQQLKERLKLE